MAGLIENHYQLYNHSNRANYLKTFQISLTFSNLNFDKIYNITINIL